MEEIIEEEDERRGLAIVVGNDAEDLPGVKKDMATMRKAFCKQDLAVWKMKDAHCAEIAGAVQAIANHTFPPEYELLIFYFCGLVGNDDEHSYIKTGECDGVDTLSVEKGIIFPLRDLHLQRMFLFDCCLENNTVKFKHPTRFPRRAFPSGVPSVSDVHVAYSTSATSCDRVDGDGGGVFTQSVAKHLIEGDAFDEVLHQSAKETVSYHEQQDGKVARHGPGSGNDKEEVDFPGSDCTFELVYHKGSKPTHPLLACIYIYSIIPVSFPMVSDLYRPPWRL